MGFPKCYGSDPSEAQQTDNGCDTCEVIISCAQKARAIVVLREAQTPKKSALDIQISGDHYKTLKIQPIEYIHANNIPFAEGCAIKYLTRWRTKGGIKDLEKAKHFIELLIELETRDADQKAS
jgi:hypothetical protein